MDTRARKLSRTGGKSTARSKRTKTSRKSTSKSRKGSPKRPNKRVPSKSRKAPRRDAAKGRPSRRTMPLPKTAKVDKKSVARTKHSKAGIGMSITDLQFMAKSRGIPFGGLTKTKLIRKINNYY